MSLDPLFGGGGFVTGYVWHKRNLLALVTIKNGGGVSERTERLRATKHGVYHIVAEDIVSIHWAWYFTFLYQQCETINQDVEVHEEDTPEGDDPAIVVRPTRDALWSRDYCEEFVSAWERLAVTKLNFTRSEHTLIGLEPSVRLCIPYGKTVHVRYHNDRDELVRTSEYNHSGPVGIQRKYFRIDPEIGYGTEIPAPLLQEESVWADSQFSEAKHLSYTKFFEDGTTIRETWQRKKLCFNGRTVRRVCIEEKFDEKKRLVRRKTGGCVEEYAYAAAPPIVSGKRKRAWGQKRKRAATRRITTSEEYSRTYNDKYRHTVHRDPKCGRVTFANCRSSTGDKAFVFCSERSLTPPDTHPYVAVGDFDSLQGYWLADGTTFEDVAELDERTREPSMRDGVCDSSCRGRWFVGEFLLLRASTDRQVSEGMLTYDICSRSRYKNNRSFRDTKHK